MTNESPFLIFKVECPVCKTINEYEQIKVGAYVEGGRDTDFCPQEIQWRFPKYQAYNPLVFFTATCSNCFYTREFSNKYREWKTDNAFRTFQLKTIKAKHLEQLSVADSIVRRLGEAVDVSRYPNESAIIKLHLAIFDGLLCDHPSYLDLGRFYLRIAWVFRTLNQGADPHLAGLTGLIREIESKAAQVDGVVADLQGAHNLLAESIRTQFNAQNLSADLQSQMFSYRDRWEVQVDDTNSLIEQLHERQANGKRLLHEYREAILGSTGGQGQPTFRDYTSLTDFLIRQQSGWNSIVINEREALEQAIRHYKEAFEGARDIAAGNQQIQAAYLIAELSRRIGDHDGARQYFTSTIKAGQEFIYQNRTDPSRTQLARKILELAIEQGRVNLKASKAD
jgi:tetratricopeptide (TPR) repeat protein